MNDLPKRKSIRIGDYDYSIPGAYFITVCTANREKIFWTDRRGELRVKSNMVYRLCNNILYTFALGSPSNR